NESPFSIQVFRDSLVTLLPLTVNVPRLEIPFSPGPIFFWSLSAKWQRAHFFSKISLPFAADADEAPWLAGFFALVFTGCSCAGSTPATAAAAIPRITTFRLK